MLSDKVPLSKIGIATGLVLIYSGAILLTYFGLSVVIYSDPLSIAGITAAIWLIWAAVFSFSIVGYWQLKGGTHATR